jgi:hypothetical protein
LPAHQLQTEILNWIDDVPGFPDQTEKDGTTVPSGSTVSGKITAKSLIITNLPCIISCFERRKEEDTMPYDDTIIPNVHPTPNLCSFDNTFFSDMDEIRYPHWIKSELPTPVSFCKSAKRQSLPFIYLPWWSYDTSLSY